MKKILKSVAAALALASASIPAIAQWAVIDPTNLIQNYISAIANIEMEISAAESVFQQTKTAIDTAKSIKRMVGVEGISDLNNSLRLYRQLQNIDGQIGSDLKAATEAVDRLSAQYGASNQSWGEFTRSRDGVIKGQRENAAKRFAAINASLEANASQRQSVLSQINTVEGQTQATQALGASLDIIIGQNQQLIGMLAADQKVKEIKDLNEEVEEVMAQKRYSEYQKRLRDSAAKYKK